MTRLYSRKRGKKGGNSSIEIQTLQAKVQTIESDLSNVKSEINNLEKQESKSTVTSGPVTYDSPVTPVTPASANPTSAILQQNIEVTGFKGTAGDAIKSIRNKITQLQKPSNKGKYTDKANKLKDTILSIQGAESVSEVETIINNTPSINFKNNALMGGMKTRKGRKGRKSRKSRKSRK